LLVETVTIYTLAPLSSRPVGWIISTRLLRNISIW